MKRNKTTELIKSTRYNTWNKPDKWYYTILATAGVMGLTVVYWLGMVADTIISLLEIV